VSRQGDGPEQVPPVERAPHPASMWTFGAAFALLIGGAAAVGVAQFQASSLAAWASLACSAAAVTLIVVALALRSGGRQ
jgi:hypothetical protein